jgi:hypothetical protein
MFFAIAALMTSKLVRGASAVCPCSGFSSGGAGGFCSCAGAPFFFCHPSFAAVSRKTLAGAFLDGGAPRFCSFQVQSPATPAPRRSPP